MHIDEAQLPEQQSKPRLQAPPTGLPPTTGHTGAEVGAHVGVPVGALVGGAVGFLVGASEGDLVGLRVGAGVGFLVGGFGRPCTHASVL